MADVPKKPVPGPTLTLESPSGGSVKVGWSGAATVEEEIPVSTADMPAPPISVAPLCLSGGYDLRAEIGRGGMGVVRHVSDRRLQRQLALKTLVRDVADGSGGEKRFVQEAQITGQLDHPNIVPVHELGRDENGCLFFTMKLVRGRTLHQVLAELGPDRLSGSHLQWLVEVIIKVCDAVAFAHSRGVIHRDLKPANIMVGDYGQVYVMDWGLALLSGGSGLVEDESGLVGTLGYMSPEQVGRDVSKIDARSDVYALGAVLYTILTGDSPYHGRSVSDVLTLTLNGPLAPPERIWPYLAMPPDLCRIAMKALARDPNGRHASVGELRDDLDQFLRGGGWLATRTLEAGKHLVREGEVAEEAFVVVSGTCAIYQLVDGERVEVRRVGPGEVIGETALLTGRARTANVVALDEVTVKVVTRAALARELERNTWTKAFVDGLADRFRELHEILAGLTGEK